MDALRKVTLIWMNLEDNHGFVANRDIENVHSNLVLVT